ncbi:hypothetical protein WMY93_001766 [Mugilogobius chulae]|uniref:Connexin cysteine-rich domain-containing protein n=1 Tax=Mugilogobius chulae TaxID=88201 RepID=A0AAW0PSA6_9GOBI
MSDTELETLKKRRLPITGPLWWTYTCSLFFRLIFEGGFMYALYFVYDGFQMPRLVKCEQWPCPTSGLFHLSAHREDRLHYFMVSSSAICMVLNVAELCYLIVKALLRCSARDSRRNQPRYNPQDTLVRDTTLLQNQKNEMLLSSSVDSSNRPCADSCRHSS